jgi:hypothetical protein
VLLAMGSVKTLLLDSVSNGKLQFDVPKFLTVVVLNDMAIPGTLDYYLNFFQFISTWPRHFGWRLLLNLTICFEKIQGNVVQVSAVNRKNFPLNIFANSEKGYLNLRVNKLKLYWHILPLKPRLDDM